MQATRRRDVAACMLPLPPNAGRYRGLCSCTRRIADLRAARSPRGRCWYHPRPPWPKPRVSYWTASSYGPASRLPVSPTVIWTRAVPVLWDHVQRLILEADRGTEESVRMSKQRRKRQKRLRQPVDLRSQDGSLRFPHRINRRLPGHGRKGKQCVKVPVTWEEKLAKAKHLATYRVALHLLFPILEKKRAANLSRCRLWPSRTKVVSPRQKSRALGELKRLGLVNVTRNPRKSP